eukprot:GGOE01003996.1.p1 GENE.GGOE01003996.1~~GGOE01003996.1.p1  ORF type:complete len:437 (-),score=85.09 GGOE01003996.1:446-1699(-)
MEPRLGRKHSSTRPGKPPMGHSGQMEEAGQGTQWHSTTDPSIDGQGGLEDGGQVDSTPPPRYEALHPANMRAAKLKATGKAARLLDSHAIHSNPFAQRQGLGKAQRRPSQQGPHNVPGQGYNLCRLQLHALQTQQQQQAQQLAQQQQQQQQATSQVPTPSPTSATAPGTTSSVPSSSTNHQPYQPVACDPYQPTYHQHHPYQPLPDFPNAPPAPAVAASPEQWAGGEEPRYPILPDSATAAAGSSPVQARAMYLEDYGWHEGAAQQPLPQNAYFDGTVPAQSSIADNYYMQAAVNSAPEPHDVEHPSAVQRLNHRPKRQGPPKGRPLKVSPLGMAVSGDASQTPSSGSSNPMSQGDVHGINAMQVVYFDGGAISTVMQSDGYCGWEHSWNGSDPNSGPLPAHGYVAPGPLPIPPNGS